MSLQFIDTLNPLQPGWNPSTISRAIPKPKAAALAAFSEPSGVFKDGLYGAPMVHVHASRPSLNPLLDGRTVVFDVIDYDAATFASGQLQVDRLIIPVSMGGVYLMVAQVDTGSSANNAAQSILIVINDQIAVARARIVQQGTLGSSFNVVALWRLNDGDFIQLQYQDEAPKANAFLNVVEPGTPSLAILRIGG